MKSFFAATSAALLIALPAPAETYSTGTVTAGFGLGQSRAVAALDPNTSDTLLGKAAEAGKFSAFLPAVEAAGVDDALRQPGKYTAFAPTDEAFAKLTAGVMETLMRPENRAELIALLRMHLVADEAITAEKANGQQLMARILLL